jgi:streptogrisin B
VKTTRRIQLLAVTSGLIAATAIALPSASAAPTAKATPDAAATLAAHLGANSTAGTYYDAASRTTVVNVTTQAAADSDPAPGRPQCRPARQGE